MRVLLTDSMFPNKYAKWRLVEIKSFIDHYKCDILIINRVNEFHGVKFELDYDDLKDKFTLNDYDILIFNPAYNYLNIKNSRIDGIKYNNTYKADYLLRHKSNSDSEFHYNIVYHIFLDNYTRFNSVFSFPQNKQYIHVYPGGGYLDKKSLNVIKPGVKVISSQQFISKFIVNNPLLNSYGGPFFYKGEKQRSKRFDSKSITVCFTSLGDSEEKGAPTYIEIAKLYKQKYPDANIKFIVIGVCRESEYINQYLKAMGQSELSNFYYENVDVLISLDSGIRVNGFPLGIEGASEGCILLTTDIHNQNKLNNFNFDPFFIIDKKDVGDIVERVRKIESDIDFRKKQAELLQKAVYELFCYTNTMEKVFNFIAPDNESVKLTPL